MIDPADRPPSELLSGAKSATPGTPGSGAADIVLDWEAYWKAFQEAHGGDPVPHAGRLLFRDGWTYSSTDYAGPEWPPPPDPADLKRLRAEYWRQQRARALAERDRIKNLVAGLEDLGRTKSAPLMVVVQYRGEAGKLTTAVKPLDLTATKVRLEFLEAALAEAARQLEALS